MEGRLSGGKGCGPVCSRLVRVTECGGVCGAVCERVCAEEYEGSAEGCVLRNVGGGVSVVN